MGVCMEYIYDTVIQSLYFYGSDYNPPTGDSEVSGNE